jgi:drug efflux transport system permease protein
MTIRWHRLLAIMRKEALQLLRDWRSLVIVAAMPIVLTLLFGYGVSLDYKHVPFCSYDRELSQKSRDLIYRFEASAYFRHVASFDSYPALVNAIESGQCKFGLVVPFDFSKQIADGGAVGVQALIDASDDNAANVIQGYSQAVIDGFSQDVQLNWLYRHGQSYFTVPLSLDFRTWFNEDLESKAFIVPGVIAILMAVIGTFLTSLTIAREWERGTMEQLVSTPVTPLEVIIGKLVPYFMIGLAGTAMCAAIGVFWFEIPFRGAVLTLFGGTALFLGSVLGLGLWISAFAKNQLVASQISLVATYMPSLVLSGFVFPIDEMPRVVQWITYGVAARYYDAILKGVFLKGVPVSTLMPEIVPLAILSLVSLAFALRTFRKRLD